jgi:outer membrane protein OmpA-like peptidoglycan-associated protein
MLITTKKVVYFKSNSATLTTAAKKSIKALAVKFKNQKIESIVVDGWAKPSKSAKSDRAISIKRSNAVAEYLSKFLPNVDIETIGNGATWSNNQKSMRAEILIATP